MHCLIIYAHPDVRSFVAAMRDAFLEGLGRQGHTYQSVDLYREGFNPALSLTELYTRESREIPSDIAAYQDKIHKADLIVLAFPTWWQGPPAIMKGFLDRVLTPGFAFEMNGKLHKGLLRGKAVIVLNSYETPRFIVKAVNGDRAFRMLKRDVFRFCGIRKVFRLSAYSLSAAAVQYREKILDKVREFGTDIGAWAIG
ncbi:MAG: NAD(P)H-dependent oxidoreductase [Bacillota bacterium]